MSDSLGQKSNQPLKKSRFQLTLFLGFLAISATLLFQNCSSPEALYNPLFDKAATASCSGKACKLDLNYLTLLIANNDPVLVKASTERSIDLAGYCDSAGYQTTKIYVQVSNGSGIDLPLYLTGATCDQLGRFRVLIDLPGTFNYSIAHSIQVILKAIDADGGELENPSRLNRKEISLLAAPAS